jgi:hypothetical protein
MSLDTTRVVPVFPPVSRAPLIAYSVFFANGSPLIASGQHEGLRAFLAPLKHCEGAEITAIGFASSARYAENNEAQNLTLVSDRLTAVEAFAKNERVIIRKAPAWPDLTAMNAARLMDDGDGSVRRPERESFNRRVNLQVTSLGSCGGSVSVQK